MKNNNIFFVVATILTLSLLGVEATAQKYIDTKPGSSDGSIKVWNEYATTDLAAPMTYPPTSAINFRNYLKVSGLTSGQYYSYRTLVGISNTVTNDNYDNITGIDNSVSNTFTTSSFRTTKSGNFYAFANAGNVYGVYGYASIGNLATTTNSTDFYGVYGSTFSYRLPGNSYGIYGNEGTNYGVSNTYAGYFNGKVHVNGTLSKSAGTFKIDHPLDPQNKYLSHSFVESPDMMNVYNGNITTNESGTAIVTLPAYFEALNIDFRYQLTTIGKFAQVMVLEKIQDNQFKIMTDKPNTEVSWQVTGIRNDAYAKKNRIKVEEEKLEKDKGKYLNAEVFGLKPEDSIHVVKQENKPKE
jgi:hypothetical protein